MLMQTRRVWVETEPAYELESCDSILDGDRRIDWYPADRPVLSTYYTYSVPRHDLYLYSAYTRPLPVDYRYM